MSYRTRRSLAGFGAFGAALLVTVGVLVAQKDPTSAFGIDPEDTDYTSFITDLPLGHANVSWQKFEDEFGDGWTTSWDARTGIPHVIYGPGIDTGSPIVDEASAASVAFDMIEEHGALFGLEGLDIDPNIARGGNTWYVDFDLYNDAIPFSIWSRFALRIKDNGVIAALKSVEIPGSIEASNPTRNAADARNRVLASILDRPSSSLLTADPELYYYVDDTATARLTWRVEVRNNDLADPYGRAFFVHAHENLEVFKIEELIHHDHGGVVRANLILGETNDPPVPGELPDARVTITSGGSGSQFTDAMGNFNFPGGTGSRTIRARLDGRWSNVNDQSGADEEQSITAGAGNGFNFLLNGAPNEFTTAETTAYYWTTVTHDFTSAVMGNNGLEFELPTNVNINSSCNAFWDGSSINFYRAGGGCPNTAHDATVVAHEYGHGVDSGRGGILNGGYSEGFGDALAHALTDQPCAGIDFFGPGTCLRNATQVRLWPAPECGSSVHCQGEVYGQFQWRVTNNLKASLGQAAGRQRATELMLLAAIGNPTSIPDAVLETFIADDDNGDLNDGTPNYDDIADAASSRNLPFPEIPALTWAFPDGLPEVLAPGSDTIRVNAIANRRTPAADSGIFHYRINGGIWVNNNMTEIAPNEYEATVPTPNCFDTIDYYFEVGLDGGGATTEPFSAPASFFSAIVATDQFVAFEDDFNTNTGWTVTNTAITDGAFVRGVPAGDGTRRDPTTDFDGSGFCFLTDNVAGNSDVDGGPTTITSPLFDLSNDGVISFAYWHSNDDGDDPFRCEVSVNGGSTWTTAFTQTGGSDGWQTHQFTLSDVALPSSTVRVRFSSTDNPNDSITESAVDAFKAQRIDCTEEQNLLLSQTELVRGSPATFSVFGASPNSTVVIHWTKGGVDPDMGPCPPEYGGLCLDLIGNVKTLITRTSNSQGQVQFTRTVPPSIPQLTVHTQAVNVQGAGGSESVKSNSVTDTIQ